MTNTATTDKAAFDCEVRIIDRERVERVRASLPERELVESVADGIFTVLSDPSRLQLILGLLEAGELCVCDAAAVSNLSESAASHALRLLRAHRIVKSRRRGRMIYYSLSDAHVRLLLDVALEHARHDAA